MFHRSHVTQPIPSAKSPYTSRYNRPHHQWPLQPPRVSFPSRPNRSHTIINALTDCLPVRQADMLKQWSAEPWQLRPQDQDELESVKNEMLARSLSVFITSSPEWCGQPVEGKNETPAA